jgi:hypothetical protein
MTPQHPETLRAAMRWLSPKEKEALTALLAEYERYEKALNQIASWQEGETVTSMCDDPGSARIARDALRATLKGEKHE